MKLPRAECPRCTKVCSVRPPRGGDGSVDVFPRHLPLSRHASYCEGSRQEVDPDQYLTPQEGSA